MAEVNLKALVAKLNTACRRALEGAAGLCLSRTNYHVELEHWLVKLLEPGDGDLPRILRHFELDVSRVQRQLTGALDRLKTGNAKQPDLSPDITDLIQEAWLLASLDFSAPNVRSGMLLLALLTNKQLRRQMETASAELLDIPAEQLRTRFRHIVDGSSEDSPAEAAAAPGHASVGGGGVSKTPALDQFTVDLTARARRQEIDPVIGRDLEIRQVIDILTRRRQNNPILTGEAGVGKTAVVEGFATKIAAGEVPESLKNIQLRTLDLALLQAGAGVKGEFENRLKAVIEEVKSSPQPIVLFVDEAHTLVGAGGSAGQGDAANLLKPALARGELRTVAATTWLEYKKYFEADPALTRRFQVVKVDEPDVPQAVRMMRGVVDKLEKHHKVRVLDEAVEDAVKLSHRYITDRQLPDKCVSLLDTVCARVALSQSTAPAAIESCQREIMLLDTEIRMLQRENAVDSTHNHRLAALGEQKAESERQLAQLQERYEKERELFCRLRELREKLEAAAQPDPQQPTPTAAELEELQKQYRALDAQLKQLQGEQPLVAPFVDGQAVAEVVSGWTGIPIGKMVRNEINAVLSLRDKLAQRVVGQDHALEAVAERIRVARSNLLDPRRPIGVFLLVGPSGVGKTETAVALADILYGGDRNMTVINMSEYKEEHKISRLTGSAPGYVGYGEGGVLTEAVRRRPYSVVLLDEIEKSNESVQEIFYQVFDKGMLQDDKGNEINFKNTIILLTSNIGTDTIMKACADPLTRPEPAGLLKMLQADLLKAFKPALLGRMTVVPYFPLDSTVLKQIIRLNLQRVASRMKEHHQAEFSYDAAVVDTIDSRCHEVSSGARNVDHIVNGTLLPAISREVLSRMAGGEPLSRVHVGVGPAGDFALQIT